MNEPRDTPADDGTHRPAVVASTRLSPIQEAYGAYTRHTLSCPTCRDIDAGPCEDSRLLRRTYLALDADARRALNGGPA